MSKQKKSIRKEFRDAVFSRDNYECQKCGFYSESDNPEEELDAHHIQPIRSLPKKDQYNPDFGITLCKVGRNCHLKAEQCQEGFTPEDLQHILDTEKALQAEYCPHCGEEL